MILMGDDVSCSDKGYRSGFVGTECARCNRKIRVLADNFSENSTCSDCSLLERSEAMRLKTAQQRDLSPDVLLQYIGYRPGEDRPVSLKKTHRELVSERISVRYGVDDSGVMGLLRGDSDEEE